MPVNEMVNILAAVVGMFGVLTPHFISYGRSRGYVGKTKRIKELVSARAELREILSSKDAEEEFPSADHIDEIIEKINAELKSLEQEQQIGLFIGFCTIEVGLFFLLTFSRLSNLLSARILGFVDEGGFGFWEGALEPVAFRILLILLLSIASVSITLKFRGFLTKKFNANYHQVNISLIVLFNLIATVVFFTSWWILVWIDRLTDWI